MTSTYSTKTTKEVTAAKSALFWNAWGHIVRIFCFLFIFQRFYCGLFLFFASAWGWGGDVSDEHFLFCQIILVKISVFIFHVWFSEFCPNNYLQLRYYNNKSITFTKTALLSYTRPLCGDGCGGTGKRSARLKVPKALEPEHPEERPASFSSTFGNALTSVREVISCVPFYWPVHVRSRLKWEAQTPISRSPLAQVLACSSRVHTRRCGKGFEGDDPGIDNFQQHVRKNMWRVTDGYPEKGEWPLALLFL